MSFSLFPKKQRLLFVCTANISRSPLAETLLKQTLQKHAELKALKIASAGIEDWSIGQPIHPKIAELLKEKGWEIPKHKSRQLKKKDGQSYTWIIGMTEQICRAARLRVEPNSKAVIVPFAEWRKNHQDIMDPTYTGDFERSYDEILEGVEKISEEIIRFGTLHDLTEKGY